MGCLRAPSPAGAGCNFFNPLFFYDWGFSPRITHPDGELAIAGASEAMGVAYIVAHYAGYSVEDILKVCGSEGPKRLLFQLYPPRCKDRDCLDKPYVAECFRHLGNLGWRGVSVTVDTVNNGNREKTYKNPDWVSAMAKESGGFPPPKSLSESPLGRMIGHTAGMCTLALPWCENDCACCRPH